MVPYVVKCTNCKIKFSIHIKNTSQPFLKTLHRVNFATCDTCLLKYMKTNSPWSLRSWIINGTDRSTVLCKRQHCIRRTSRHTKNLMHFRRPLFEMTSSGDKIRYVSTLCLTSSKPISIYLTLRNNMSALTKHSITTRSMIPYLPLRPWTIFL